MVLRKDRDDQHSKAKDLTAELNSIKSNFYPALFTESSRLLQHAKKHVSSDGALLNYWFGREKFLCGFTNLKFFWFSNFRDF